MADTVNKETRSRMMSSVRAKNTKLELEMRRRLFAMGFRYRLHEKDLPGTPDMLFPKYQAVTFVHGCFWHYHGCHLSSIPGTRRSWWKKKLEDNARRDSETVSELRNLGWRVLIIWECGFRRPKTNRAQALDTIAERAADFLKSTWRLLEIPRLPRGRKGLETGKGRSHGEKKR
jgi:DNA mismatch endonuclease (patch repair protein)